MRVHRTIERPTDTWPLHLRFADRKSLTVHAMPTPQHGDALWWRAPGLKESRDRGIERCLRHSPANDVLHGGLRCLYTTSDVAFYICLTAPQSHRHAWVQQRTPQVGRAEASVPSISV